MNKKLASGLLAASLLVSLLPVSAAATGKTLTADVTLTVMNKGVPALTMDGETAVSLPVTVTALNEAGALTYDEALTAAHALYNTEDGFSAPGGWVSRLWGVDTFNSLFITNDVANSETVSSAPIKDGDRLVASINSDDLYYADWYTCFDQTAAEVYVGDELTLTVTGYQGMMGGEAVPVEGLSVGCWEDGSFVGIEDAVTDEKGTVTISCDEAGTYLLLASGTVSDTVTTDWTTYATATVDCPIIPAFCVVTVKDTAVSRFADVNEGDWFAPYVDTVYRSGLMAGTSDTAFTPSGIVTRAMVVTTLYSMAGKPEVTGESSFTDAVSDLWYYNALVWAEQNGIAAGYSDGTFGVDDPVTREQTATFLYANEKLRASDAAPNGDLSAFSDGASVSGWAKEAMTWAVGCGLFSGRSVNGSVLLAPQAQSQRSELATILASYAQK